MSEEVGWVRVWVSVRVGVSEGLCDSGRGCALVR